MGWLGFGKKKKRRRGAARSDSLDIERSVDAESSPQRVGLVSGVLSTTAEGAEPGAFSDVVSRHFGPGDSGWRGVEVPSEPGAHSSRGRRDHLRAVEPIESNHPALPELEVEPMAHIGRATTITGTIVSEEDLEIFGTVEGSVRLAEHQVSVGAEGHVKASLEARVVHVVGRVTGDVVASELVEIEAGGVVGGDVRAPRMIMHDGAIVVGALDMSAALPRQAEPASEEAVPAVPEPPARPQLKKVELPAEPEDEARDEGAAD